MQKVLFIGAVWPEPKSSAGGIRMMQLLHLFLRNSWHITFASSAADSEFAEDITALGIDKVSIELNNSSFDEFVKNLNPNVVVFDRFMSEEQYGWRVAESAPNALRIIETIDLHCLRTSRQEQLKSGEDLKTTLLKSDTAKRELASYFRSDLNLIISDEEIPLIQDVFNFPSEQLFYLPYKIPSLSEDEKLNLPSFEEREHFITIGNFKHEPNWDSVRYLKETIWPLIRAKMPQAQLHVYGSYAGSKVLQLHKPSEGFHVLGRAEDALVVMKKARVCLAPLRFGAGIKGKLAEAMLCGTPSVTSAVGAEGLRGDMNWNGVITENISEFVDAAVVLYQDENRWKEAQQNGFSIIEKRFETLEKEQDFIAHINHLLQNIQEHRSKNFVGSMLLHHSLQSTKYLSKWIEEKNRRDELHSS
jgi:glycosyltransferase involved in cell wall biosynthesis